MFDRVFPWFIGLFVGSTFVVIGVLICHAVFRQPGYVRCTSEGSTVFASVGSLHSYKGSTTIRTAESYVVPASTWTCSETAR